MKKLFMIMLFTVFGFNVTLFANPVLKLITKTATKQAAKSGAKTIGREVAETGVKASLKQGTKLLVKNADNVALPILKKAALETTEHTVTNPKIMQKLVVNFGDDAALKIVKNVPQSEMPMFIRYVEAADSPATRKLFVECYKKEGTDIFRRIPPKIIIATGLSAAMLYGTHRATAPMVATAESIEKNPNVANNFVNKSIDGLQGFFLSLFTKPLLLITIVLCILLLNKCGIFGQLSNFMSKSFSKQNNRSEEIVPEKIKPIKAVVCDSDSVKI